MENKDIWSACLYRLKRRINNKNHNNKWFNKINSCIKTWNIWYIQINGEPPKQVSVKKQYITWKEKLPLINERWTYHLRQRGWNRRFDYIRRYWIDTSEQLKGGICSMGSEMKNERLTIKDLREMLDKQNFRCALTGKKLTPQNCSIDHIVPLSKGGQHTKDNAQLILAEVNKAKNNFTEEEFISLCEDVVNFKNRKVLPGG